MKINTLLIVSLFFVVISCKSAASSVATTEAAAADSRQREDITEKYWKLIEINGKPVELNETFAREPYIKLREDSMQVIGHGGCNQLSGTYEIDREIQRIRFSQMVSTMMACINMEIEGQLKKVLEMTDNYSISDDGRYLSLNRARMSPLARFEVIYF